MGKGIDDDDDGVMMTIYSSTSKNEVHIQSFCPLAIL